MNFKNILLYVCILCLSAESYSQKREKIKGNREVTINITELDAFNAITLNDDFEIELLESNSNSVEIEADSNLQDIIEIETTDSVLSFYKSKRISTKKKLRILVNYSTPIYNINLSENSELRSLNSLKLDSLNINTSDNAKAYINIEARIFNINANGKSKLKLNIEAVSSQITLKENSKLDAIMEVKNSEFNLMEKSSAKLDGSIDTSIISLDGNAYFNSPDLIFKELKLVTSIDSDAKLNVTDLIEIEASGDSEIYLFGNPKINILSFFDSAKLQKKE